MDSEYKCSLCFRGLVECFCVVGKNQELIEKVERLKSLLKEVLRTKSNLDIVLISDIQDALFE